MIVEDDLRFRDAISHPLGLVELVAFLVFGLATTIIGRRRRTVDGVLILVRSGRP